ncbi:T3SS effector HopA1 family protein [Streptomyces radiopugnans]|uniref:T3SS effector HopA1 family protein n=1 Tax=Streptomyces radiopugnans TaxID=403935 RepID=UPI003F1CB919
MTTVPRQGLCARLEEVLTGLTVEASGRTALIGERLITAPSPRALTGQLATALYRTLHVGRPSAEPADDEEQASARRAGEDRDLEAGLAAGVPHRHSRYRARVLSVAAEGLVVQLSGVRVRVPPEWLADRTSCAPGTPAGAEAGILLAAARRSLSPGFFLVDGTRPLTRQEDVLRVYLHVETPEAVLDAWERTLRCLEEQGVAYRAKAISSSGSLPRRDGIVVYLGSEDQGAVAKLLGAVRDTALGAGASPFTRPLARGVSMAWEPADPRPGTRNISFGEHRSRALAKGLVDHAARSDGALAGRAEAVRQALLEAGIDPSEPARNLSSPPFSVNR